MQVFKFLIWFRLFIRDNKFILRLRSVVAPEPDLEPHRVCLALILYGHKRSQRTRNTEEGVGGRLRWTMAAEASLQKSFPSPSSLVPSLQAELSSHAVHREPLTWMHKELEAEGAIRKKKILPRENTSRLMFSDLNNYLVSLYKHHCYIINSRGNRGRLWTETCLTCCLGVFVCMSAVSPLNLLFNVLTWGPVAIKLTAARSRRACIDFSELNFYSPAVSLSVVSFSDFKVTRVGLNPLLQSGSALSNHLVNILNRAV